MAQVVVTQEAGQLRIDAQVPAETVLLLLTQAVELVRVQVVAKQVALAEGGVKLAPATALSPNGQVGLRGGDVEFRRGSPGG